MNRNFKRLIKGAKEIKLSEKEKETLRYRISEFVSFNPIRGKNPAIRKSFYFSVFTLRNLSKGLAMVLVAVLVVGGTGVSYASTDSLPGDKLYTVKVNVNEKIEEKLAFTTEAKVVVQTQKVERRLTEVQKLAETKKLSPEKKEIVKHNLEKNISSVTKTIETLKEEGKTEKALDVVAMVTPVLEAHKEVLVEKNKQEKEEADSMIMMAKFSTPETESSEKTEEEFDKIIESVDAAIKKVEEVEEKVIDEIVKNESETISDVAIKNTEEASQKIEEVKENLVVENDLALFNNTEAKTAKTAPEDAMLMSTLSAEIILIEETAQEFSIDQKIKEAEDLIKQSDLAKSVGNFKESLTLSQKAKKIIQQIEEYKKIKSAEIIPATEETKEVPKETVADPIKEAETTPSVEVKTDIKTETKTEINPGLNIKELEAAAIKSLEETNESLKKINFNQSTQNHL
ncbi:MAG: hypothetical protein QG580_384 [Patescibacteria group bacterium]|jgi:hypothetical protein|nr:hypothetical protein [Patescibacteria group bacterium]